MEEGVREDHHSVVVIHQPRVVVLLNGSPVNADGGFGGDGMQYEFTVEDGVQAVYRLIQLPAGGAGGEAGGVDAASEGGWRWRAGGRE